MFTDDEITSIRELFHNHENRDGMMASNRFSIGMGSKAYADSFSACCSCCPCCCNVAVDARRVRVA
jgi:hypothetical protein